MKHFLLICTILTCLPAIADNVIENYNCVSDEYEGTISDVKIIRNLNGGSIIIPEFDSSCPEEMKGPFMYACKIVEEYLKPCLPIKITVACNELRKNKQALSVVNSIVIDSISDNYSTCCPFSALKAIALAEASYHEYYRCVRFIPNVAYLTTKYDFHITYNSSRTDDFSFSLDTPPADKYDFVTIAIRDLLTGLGLSHSFDYIPVSQELHIKDHLTPFEKLIEQKLNSNGDPKRRLENATKGELELLYANKPLKLYAPSPWNRSSSLKYFIPHEDCGISQILSYSLGKGSAIRSISDKYDNYVFGELLGWKPDLQVGISPTTPSLSHAGSTSNLMPYNGHIDINFSNDQSRSSDYSRDYVSDSTFEAPYSNDAADDDVVNLLLQYHPFRPGGDDGTGTTISILKKDGSWDLVKFSGDFSDSASFDMSDLEFHFDASAYARTADGYLRARATKGKYKQFSRGYDYESQYFAIDYTPQSIDLSYKLGEISTQSSSLKVAKQNQSVRLYFSNLEGAERVTVERLRAGARVPSRIEISNFKSGFFDTTIDQKTSFTAIAYNKNGTSKSNQITVTPTANTRLDFELKDQYIRVISSDEMHSRYEYEYEYDLIPLTAESRGQRVSGTTDEIINISRLKPGTYLLSVDYAGNESPQTFKFSKPN